MHFKNLVLNYHVQFHVVSVGIRHDCCENFPVKVWRKRKYPGSYADSWEVSTALQTMIDYKYVHLSQAVQLLFLKSIVSFLCVFTLHNHKVHKEALPN